MEFSQKKFLALNTKQQHKLAAKELNKFHTNQEERCHLTRYNQMATMLGLSPLGTSFEERSDRYYLHLTHAATPLTDSDLLTGSSKDTLSKTPFGDIDTYLYNLRSAHNVGSIMRTIEAFRLGNLLISPMTPGPSNSQVQKASMGTSPIVPVTVMSPDNLMAKCKKPLIAIETAPHATSIHEFIFPTQCTLIMGSEAYGIPQEILTSADHVVTIPLCGGKNSLNVANAFAIAASMAKATKK